MGYSQISEQAAVMLLLMRQIDTLYYTPGNTPPAMIELMNAGLVELKRNGPDYLEYRLTQIGWYYLPSYSPKSRPPRQLFSCGAPEQTKPPVPDLTRKNWIAEEKAKMKAAVDAHRDELLLSISQEQNSD